MIFNLKHFKLLTLICWYMKQTLNKKSSNTSQNLTKGLYQPKFWNFLCKSDKTKKKKKGKLNPESKTQSSLFQHWSQYPNHIQNQKGENTQVYKWISSSDTIQIPTFSHSETNAVELFLGKKEKSSPNDFFKVTSRKCASFCLFPWRLIGGRRGLFLYSPPLEQDTIRC